VKLLATIVLAACSTTAPPEPKKQHAPHQAGPPGITKITGYDPGSGLHLDDDADHPAPAATPQPPHPGHPIDVTLRSSPPGAQVVVDGTNLGTTPAYWYGQADGREHEFTFLLSGHAAARYRFVPVSSGLIFARLTPVERPDIDDESPEGSAAPAPGSMLINPPPAPVKVDAQGQAPAVDAATAPGSSEPSGMGPQP
jgi:hypothetical protein